MKPYSKHLASWVARGGLGPSALSAVSLLAGLDAAAWFALGSRPALLVGALFLLVAFAVGRVADQLAQWARHPSSLGGWLDAIVGRAKEYVVYAGLAVGAAASDLPGAWALAVAALGVQTVRHMVDLGYAEEHPRVVAALPSGSRGERTDEPAETQTVLTLRTVDGGSGSSGEGGSRRRRPLLRRFGGGAIALLRRLVRGAVTWARRRGVATAALAQRLGRRPAARWFRRVAVLPTGARFVLLSLTAALGGARVALASLLAWGGLAVAATTVGRVVRSQANPRKGGHIGGVAAAALSDSPASAHRDDGPLAGAVGFVGVVGLLPYGWQSRSLALGLTILGMGVPLALLGFPSTWLPAAGVAWCVVVAGAFAGHRHPGRLDWLVPPLLRVGEYAVVAVLGLASSVPSALVFVVLAAIVYHHYDQAYRDRRLAAVPAWLGRLGLGWDGRMLVAAVAAATAVVVPAYAALAGALWALFLTESVTAWLRSPGSPGSPGFRGSPSSPNPSASQAT